MTNAIKKYFVYKHIAPNNKCYIGITSKRKVEDRWLKGLGYKRKDKNGNYSHFYNAILKYGWDNFEHKVLAHGLTKEQAERWEIKLIKYYKSNYSEFGYNKTYGGESNIPSEETLAKYFEKPIICLDTLIVYKSIRHASRKLNLDSSTISKVCLKKNKSVKNLHFMFLYEYMNSSKDIIIDLINSDRNGIKIICYETKEIFYSISLASKKYNISRTNIGNCLSGRKNDCWRISLVLL